MTVALVPSCPNCDTKMKPRHYHGYYDRFAFWQCECKVIPNATVAAGGYGYVTEGVLVDSQGNPIEQWDDDLVDQ